MYHVSPQIVPQNTNKQEIHWASQLNDVQLAEDA